MKYTIGISLFIILMVGYFSADLSMKLNTAYTVDSLGACQGVSYQQGRIFLYGDREVGMIREYTFDHDSLLYLHKEMKLTIKGSDVIGHPTGLAVHGSDPVFIGNSIRMNPEGTSWKAVIYCVDWKGLQRTGTLDGNLINTIEDDTCIQGCRPEYVQYKNKWYVATADYGEKTNEVRLYDPSVLKTAKKTSEKGVVYKKFSCSPWVQNLCWIPEKNLVVLIQNQIEGRKWRFSYVDLARSIESGKAEVIKVVDTDRGDELEGYAFAGSLAKGIAVSSSRKNNVTMMDVNW
jgi:hypothetical protein